MRQVVEFLSPGPALRVLEMLAFFTGGGPFFGGVRSGRFSDLDKRYVYTVSADGAVEYRAVKLGPIIDGLRVVRSGLKPNDVVVVNGLQRVRPGVHIDPVAVSDPQLLRQCLADGFEDLLLAGGSA